MQVRRKTKLLSVWGFAKRPTCLSVMTFVLSDSASWASRCLCSSWRDRRLKPLWPQLGKGLAKQSVRKLLGLEGF